MNIEELAGVSLQEDEVINRSYDNIRKMRSQVLQRSFLYKDKDYSTEPLLTIAGVEYMDLTPINSLNKIWLLFEKSIKNIIWILDFEDFAYDIGILKETLHCKVKNIILVENAHNANEIKLWKQKLNNIVHIDTSKDLKGAMDIAKHISLEGERVVYMNWNNCREDGNGLYKAMVYNQ